MVRFSIDPKKTALLVIDMQNAFLKPGAVIEVAAGRAMIPKLKELMRICGSRGIQVIFTKTVYHPDGFDMGLLSEFITKKVLVAGTEDVELYSGIEPQTGDIVFDKHRYDAFIGTDLDLVLSYKGIDTIMIGGVVTHMCCESTARSAHMRNYKVIFLSDGTAAYNLPDQGWGPISAEEVQRFVLTNLAYRYAQVSSIDEVIRQISELH